MLTSVTKLIHQNDKIYCSFLNIPDAGLVIQFQIKTELALYAVNTFYNSPYMQYNIAKLKYLLATVNIVYFISEELITSKSHFD